MIRSIIEDSKKRYNINGASYQPLTKKSSMLKCDGGQCYFVKRTELYTEDKYRFLNEQAVSNVLYPIKNQNGRYVSNIGNDDLYYIMPYYQPTKMIDEVKVAHLTNQLSSLHAATYYKKQLSVLFSRKKVEELYEYLQYKFSVIEVFIRSVESRPFDEYSIMILKNYQYILNGEKHLAQLHKKLIQNVKAKKSVNHSFVHNNPKLEHLLNVDGNDYLISIEKSKIGIPSLDIAKFYIEIEDINIDTKEIIMDYFKNYDDDFYFDYFCFLVLLYYVKGIIVVEKDYATSQSFIYSAQAIKKFCTLFLQEANK